jgi:Flp pilus assembly protein CpaB
MFLVRSPLRRLRHYPLIWWMLVALIAGVAGFVVTTSVASAQSAARRYEGLVNVAVATHALRAGETLTPTDVRTETRPRAFLSHAEAVLSPVGRTLTTPIAAGEVITELNAGGAGLSATASLIDNNERAVALSLQGLHPTLSIGDRVDVLATFERSDVDAEPTVTVTEGARVVQLNEDSVMVAVPSTDVAKVAFAATRGEVVLAMSSSAGRTPPKQ